MNKINKYIIAVLIIVFSVKANAQENLLSLSNAIEKVLEKNYGIVISKSEVEIAKINNSWGTAGRLPTVDFDVSSTNNNDLLNNTSTNRISGGIGVNWTIFNGFKVNITKDKLEKLESLIKGRSAVVVESTIQDVIMSYYNILLQKEQLEVLKTVMQLSKDRFDYEQTRFEIGGSVTYNVLLVKNIYLNDKALYLNQEVIVRNTIRNFNFLVGEDSQQVWIFSEKFNSDTTEYVLGDLMDKMMANNQTLQNQYVNLLLQKNEIDIQRSNLYPRLSLSTGIDNSYSWIKSETQDTYNKGLTPYGNLSLSYDIYSAGNRKRAINIAKINEEITQVETEEMKHSLTNQLFNEYDVYNLRKTLLNVANESLEAAEMNLQIAEEKYKTGAINSFNYRDIQLSYLRSAMSQLQSVYNLLVRIN
jgi:outer membrane protein TolC